MVPYASHLASALETLTPPTRLVSPLSPFRLKIFITYQDQKGQPQHTCQIIAERDLLVIAGPTVHAARGHLRRKTRVSSDPDANSPDTFSTSETPIDPRTPAGTSAREVYDQSLLASLAQYLFQSPGLLYPIRPHSCPTDFRHHRASPQLHSYVVNQAPDIEP